MKKKLVALLLVLTLAVCIFPASAFAEGNPDSGIMPCYVTIYYINATNVNLRSGASTTYSSGGQVSKPDRCEPLYKNGTSYFKDENGDPYVWRYIHMTSGQCSGLSGYVVSQYVSENKIPADS